MSTKDYFNEQLKVQFTMSELMNIASALATEYFTERKSKRDSNAENAWKIHEKVNKYIENYNNIYK